MNYNSLLTDINLSSRCKLALCSNIIRSSRTAVSQSNTARWTLDKMVSVYTKTNQIEEEGKKTIADQGFSITITKKKRTKKKKRDIWMEALSRINPFISSSSRILVGPKMAWQVQAKLCVLAWVVSGPDQTTITWGIEINY